MSKSAVRKMMNEAKAEATEKAAEATKAEKAPKAEKAERAEKVEKAEKTENLSGQLSELKAIMAKGFEDSKRKLEKMEGQFNVHTQFIAGYGKRLDRYDRKFENAEARLKKLEGAVFEGGKEDEKKTQPAATDSAPKGEDEPILAAASAAPPAPLVTKSAAVPITPPVTSSVTSPVTPPTGNEKTPKKTAPLGGKVNMIDFASPVTFWAPWDAKNGCWGVPLKSVFAAEAAGYGERPKKVFIWVDRETGKAQRALTPEEIVLYTEHAIF